MAESLGAAVLTVSVDDKQLRAGLKAAEQQAKVSGQQISQSFNNTGRALQTAANGIQYFVDAQGRARSATGQFLTLAQRQAAGLQSVGDAAAAASTGLAAGLGAFRAAPVVAGIAATAAGVAGIGFAATQSAGSIQKLQAAFVGLKGSAQAAAQLRQELFTLSKATPFRNDELLQAAQRFLAVGVGVKDLGGTINRVGALAAQSGQPLERLALIYAQVFAKGRLQGEENLQFLEAGVDLTQELSQVTGLSGTALQDAMSKGQIGLADVNKALVLATGNMSALKLAGQAVDVQFNNIFDNFGQLFGGFAQAIAPALSAGFQAINTGFEAAFPSLESITQYFQPLAQEAQRFADLLNDNPEVIQAITLALKELGGTAIQGVVNGIKSINDTLSQIDVSSLITGFIQTEVVIRKAYKSAVLLAQALLKASQITAKAATNPIGFGIDLVSAGGYAKFLQKEFGFIKTEWDKIVKEKPLTLPEVKLTNTGALPGNLSDKNQGQQDLSKVEDTSNSKVVDAYRDAGNSLLDGARAAADRLRSAGDNLQSTLRGGFEFLTGFQQERQIRQAQLSVRAAQSAGFIRTDLNLSNPDRLFAAASFAENVLSANRELQSAQQESVSALSKLANKDWVVNVSVNSDGSSSAYGDVLNGALAV